MMKKNYLRHVACAATLLGCLSQDAAAQSSLNCGTTGATMKLYQAHPELIQQDALYNASLGGQIRSKMENRAAEAVYTIPVVFHILHTYGTENISDAQILDQVAILNRDYAALNADLADIVDNTPFDTLAADTKIQFKLAQLDPNGECTNGIDRIYTHLTNEASDASKLNQWPREKYLNVWVVKSIGDAGVAGYAYYPSAVSGPLAPFDGILILHNYIGSIGSASLYNSRALTHEVGHWLSLQHPWGSTNEPEVACGDDLVEDTPETMGHLSCTTVDLYQPMCTIDNITTMFNFADVTLTSGTTDPTMNPADSGTTYSAFTANGVATNPSDSNSFTYADWELGGAAGNGDSLFSLMTGSINTAKYYEVTVTPKFGRSMTLTGLTFTARRNATGARSYAVRSSVGGYATNLAASIAPANPMLQIQGTSFFSKYDTVSALMGNKITLATGFVNLTTPVTFRIYAWDAEDASGTFGIDDLSFQGTSGVIENTQNYMDYSYCSVMFTKGQKERMRAALESPVSGRNNLWSATNLAATGTDGSGVACAPVPDFYANRYRVCAGATVTYQKNIMNTIGAAPTVQWFFEGGSPSTSTASSPVVTYSTPGYYDVKLVATNAAGTDSVIKNELIHVTGVPFYYGLAQENFENTTTYFYQWDVDNYDAGSNTWGLSSSAGTSGTHSVFMTGYNNYENDVDDLVTPAFNLFGLTGGNLTFKCAGSSRATAPADMTEVLKVYSSTDCGATWQIRKTFNAYPVSGSAYFVNAGYHPEYFIPTASDWVEQIVPIPASVATGRTKFKFEYTSGMLGNNVYIDDINITGVVGIGENITEGSVTVYPNPSNSTTTISYLLNREASVSLQIVDVMGKVVLNQQAGTQAEGEYKIVVDKTELGMANGLYFVQLVVDGHPITKKLMITE
jgi:PKD repeat protein